MSEIRIARLEERDLGALLEGYAACFPHPMDPHVAAWKYLGPPQGPATILGAWRGDALLGGYVLIPREFRFGDRTGLCYQRTDAWVLKAHRRDGIYNRLVDAGMAAASEAGASFLFGFPNEHPGAAQNRRGVVFEVPLRRRIALLSAPKAPGIRGLILRLALPLRRARVLDEVGGFVVRELEPEALETRISAPPATGVVSLVAGAPFWRWRYMDPAAGNITVLAVDRDGEPVLTAALEWGKLGTYVLGFHVGDDAVAAVSALRLVLGRVVERGSPRATHEANAAHDEPLLRTARFLPHPRTAHATVHLTPGSDLPLEPEAWAFTLGDRDVVEAP